MVSEAMITTRSILGTTCLRAATTRLAAVLLLCTHPAVGTDDEGGSDDSELTTLWSSVPIDSEPHAIADPMLQEIAERIVNGRANLNLIGDSITHADLSAAYLATFRPVHGIRGYAVSGRMFSHPPWSAYTNAISNFTPELLALPGSEVAFEELWCSYPDDAGHWRAYDGPHNVCRITALADLPDALPLREMGAGNYHDLIWADDRALTRTGSRLRHRLLWYDHPDAMPFTVEGGSTLPPEAGGTTERFEVVPERPAELVCRWLEIPEPVVLGTEARALERNTSLVVRSAPGHLETPGEQLLIGGARVWDEAAEAGVQWGWTTTSGIQSTGFNAVSVEAWSRHIAFQQSDTYLVMLGVNDILAGNVGGYEVAGRIRRLLERIRTAHDLARSADPDIRPARFLLITPCDGRNTTGNGNYYDNRQWVELASALGALARLRDDTACIDLRAMVEAEFGAWRTWRSTLTRDGVHPRGPYFHVNGDVRWDCTPHPDGAMHFARMVWDTLWAAAVTRPPVDHGDLCAADLVPDCLIDDADLEALLAEWGEVEPGAPVDFNRDGHVDDADLMVLLESWGACP